MQRSASIGKPTHTHTQQSICCLLLFFHETRYSRQHLSLILFKRCICCCLIHRCTIRLSSARHSTRKREFERKENGEFSWITMIPFLRLLQPSFSLRFTRGDAHQYIFALIMTPDNAHVSMLFLFLLIVRAACCSHESCVQVMKCSLHIIAIHSFSSQDRVYVFVFQTTGRGDGLPTSCICQRGDSIQENVLLSCPKIESYFSKFFALLGFQVRKFNLRRHQGRR